MLWTYLVDGEVGEQRLRLLVRHRGVDNDIVALLPVHGGGYTVLVTDLEGYVDKRICGVSLLSPDVSDIK